MNGYTMLSVTTYRIITLLIGGTSANEKVGNNNNRNDHVRTGTANSLNIRLV